MTKKITNTEKKLIRRYLIWCFKTTQEELDRIDRKFTQLKVDYFLLSELKPGGRLAQSKECGKHLDDFKTYIKNKENSNLNLKFLNEKNQILNPHYAFLSNRLTAIKKAITVFLGPKELKHITLLYEEEMAKRILESREHT